MARRLSRLAQRGVAAGGGGRHRRPAHALALCLDCPLPSNIILISNNIAMRSSPTAAPPRAAPYNFKNSYGGGFVLGCPV